MTMVIMTKMKKNYDDTRHNFYRRNAQSSIQAESWKPWESVPPGLPYDDHYGVFSVKKMLTCYINLFGPPFIDTYASQEIVILRFSSHGGLLDNPGLVTKCCGNVLDKWDQVTFTFSKSLSLSQVFYNILGHLLLGSLSMPCLKTTLVHWIWKFSSSLAMVANWENLVFLTCFLTNHHNRFREVRGVTKETRKTHGNWNTWGLYFAWGNMDTGQFHNLSNLPWTVATKWTCEALVREAFIFVLADFVR